MTSFQSLSPRKGYSTCWRNTWGILRSNRLAWTQWLLDLSKHSSRTQVDIPSRTKTRRQNRRQLLALGIHPLKLLVHQYLQPEVVSPKNTCTQCADTPMPTAWT